MCIPHQMPRYLCGFIHETSDSTFSSFRFKIKYDVIRSPGFSAICNVRQGDVKLPSVFTRSPSAQGTRYVFKPLSVGTNVIQAKSTSLASCILTYSPPSVLIVNGVCAVSSELTADLVN